MTNHAPDRYPGRRGPHRALVLLGSLALLGCLLAAMLSAAFGSKESQWLGMELEPLTPSLRVGLGLPPEQAGAYVSDVVGLARQSGVREGDVIVAVNGRPVRDLTSLRQARRDIDPAATALVTMNRQGNLLTVTLGATAVAAPAVAAPVAAQPAPQLSPTPYLGGAALPAPARAWGPTSRTDFGADLVDLSAATANSLGLPRPARGALLTGLSSGLAAQAGLQRGDVILHLNGFDVVEADQFWSQLAAQPPGSTVILDVYRAGRLLQTSLVAGGSVAVQQAAWAPCPLR